MGERSPRTPRRRALSWGKVPCMARLLPFLLAAGVEGGRALNPRWRPTHWPLPRSWCQRRPTRITAKRCGMNRLFQW